MGFCCCKTNSCEEGARTWFTCAVWVYGHKQPGWESYLYNCLISTLCTQTARLGDHAYTIASLAHYGHKQPGWESYMHSCLLSTRLAKGAPEVGRSWQYWQETPQRWRKWPLIAVLLHKAGKYNIFFYYKQKNVAFNITLFNKLFF